MQVRQVTHQNEELTICDVEKDAVRSQCFLELFMDVFVGAAAEKEKSAQWAQCSGQRFGGETGTTKMRKEEGLQ